ncbi:MAG TPA: hypothetical protein VGK32_17385 [Vicinamibacterales bacterium]
MAKWMLGCAALLLWGTVPAAAAGGQTQAPSPATEKLAPPDYSQEAAVIEQARTTISFDGNATGRRDDAIRLYAHAVTAKRVVPEAPWLPGLEPASIDRTEISRTTPNRERQFVSSPTFSIQSSVPPSSASWMAICVMAVASFGHAFFVATQ